MSEGSYLSLHLYMTEQKLGVEIAYVLDENSFLSFFCYSNEQKGYLRKKKGGRERGEGKGTHRMYFLV